MLNVNKIRQDFPILKTRIHGKPLAYLDNAATTQKPQVVIDAISDYYRNYNANIHRGMHYLAEKATEAYEDARKTVARFINTNDPSEIIFVRNATEAINLVAYSWGRQNLSAGDTIVLTEMEHHANIIPWLMLKQEKGVEIEYVRVDSDGYLDINHLKDLLDQKPKLLSLTHISNVLGTINPLAKISRLAGEENIPILVDAAQSTGHLGFNVKKHKIDFLAFTGHKILGPTGIGVLWAKKEHLEKMPPFLGGGEMIDEVYFDRFTLNNLPQKFEAGTPHIAGAIGLKAAIDYLDELGLKEIREYELKLTAYAITKLQNIPGICLLGPLSPTDRGALISFTLKDIHPHDIAAVLDIEGVAIRSGHHCAMPLHNTLGIPASARASFCFYNTEEEIDRLVEGIRKTIKTMGKREHERK
ncbi:cysteine desulfurase [Patescibacteria group bacterium]|nr:cysteine desulfurase [Patescibacteria group bacterium]